MKYHPLFLLTIFLAIASCTAPAAEANNETNTSTAEAPNSAVEKLPSIPVPILQKLYDECNYVDYLFYASNFSMSIDNKQSIQKTLTHISQEVPTLNIQCAPIGRIFYEIDGNTELEAEIYFSNKCQHFVFMKGNKKLYANNITPDGVAHFNNIFNQAKAMNK